MDLDRFRRSPGRQGGNQRIRRRWPLPWGGSLWLTILLALLGLLAFAAGAFYLLILKDLPRLTSIKDYQPLVVTAVYAEDARKVGELYIERRKVLPLEQMPKRLIQSFLAAEDSRFYEHKGVDLIGILRASLKNIEAGHIVQGGSTITQQVTKTFFLSPERSVTRKLKEAILSWRLEKYLSKDEILHLYLNQIYLGNGAYGVEAAAETYFGKPARTLTLAECALLAGLPQAPSRYSPYENPQKARERQLYVLNRMVESGFITNEEASRAVNDSLVYRGASDPVERASRYYLQAVRQYLVERYGTQVALGSGLKVYTALNVDLQRAAAAAVSYGARAYDKRHGYRAATKQLKPEEIDNYCAAAFWREGGTLARGHIYTAAVLSTGERLLVRVGNRDAYVPLKDPAWGRLKPRMFQSGDVIQVRWMGEEGGFRLEQKPVVQAALVALEPGSGMVRALIGGTDFDTSEYNRAIQARRQPGSAFKPIIYAGALEKGYTVATTILDAPLELVGSGEDGRWNPKNFEGEFYGPTLFRTGLIRSRNVVTVKILKDIGVDYVADYARRLGITSPLTKDLSLSLGSSVVSLMELTSAYAPFANFGQRVSPVLVTRVEDAHGRVLERNGPRLEQAIDPATASVMSHLLREVVEEGTGWQAKRLGRPAAGKTGTTNNYLDAWFVGFVPGLAAGVWIGHDDQRSLGHGETGAQAAAPIWVEFMQQATANKPVETFPVAPGVVFVRIDPVTGLLAAADSEAGVFECFKEGTAPVDYASPYRGQEDFFRQDMGAPRAAPPISEGSRSPGWGFD
jgi:penicillin-binding protein 1A